MTHIHNNVRVGKQPQAKAWLLRFVKDWTLPVAIATGTALYLLFAYVPALEPAASVCGPVCEAVLPLTIFATLFVTFSKVDFHLMHLERWHAAILAAQGLCVAVLTAILTATDGGPTRMAMEAVMTCVIAPCASASPVVTAKLGGNLTAMTTFTLLSAIATSVLIPAIFPLIEPEAHTTFATAFLQILHKVAAVLLLPLALGAIVRHYWHALYRWLMGTPDLGFYLWSISLAITTGITVRNIAHSHAAPSLLAAIAMLTLLTAFAQFRIGRAIGKAYKTPICAGQAMFQKNTALAIWVSFAFLTPTASIGAGCYVLWQNIINSAELWQHRRFSAATQGGDNQKKR